jgi:hypothetical protein
LGLQQLQFLNTLNAIKLDENSVCFLGYLELSDKTVKKINYRVGVVGFLLFVGLFVSEDMLPTLLGGRVTWLPAIDGLFLASIGLAAVVLGIVNSIASWTRTAEEYTQLLSLMIFPSWGKRALFTRSDRYWLWQARLTQPLTILIGLAFFFSGLSSL